MDFSPGNRDRIYRLLNNTHKLLSNVQRFAAVESKNILVQVVLKVFRFKSSLKSTSYQALHQRGYQVSAIELVVIFALALIRYFTTILLFINDIIAGPFIRCDQRAGSNVVENEFPQ